MNRLLTILLLAAGTAYGQINNPPTSVNITDATATGRAVLTATNAAAAATAVGLGTTNSVTFQSLTAELLQVTVGTNLYVSLAEDVNEFWTDVAVNETLSVSGSATFSTNVTVNGNLSVGSLTTTTPSTWALDATETAAATNGILALPSNANVIRLTNNNAISGVSGGVLGAFYYLVNQTTNAVTISNVGGITVQGGTPLTLGANQAATLVATGATNASVAARGDLNDVALGGTANTAPSQTASSGSSLMTRDLSDDRYGAWENTFEISNFSGLTAGVVSGGTTTIGSGYTTLRVASGGSYRSMFSYYRASLTGANSSIQSGSRSTRAVFGNEIESRVYSAFYPVLGNVSSQWAGRGVGTTTGTGVLPYFLYYDSAWRAIKTTPVRGSASVYPVRASDVITIESNGAHNLTTNDFVSVAGVFPQSMQTWRAAVLSTPTANSFTYANVGADETGTTILGDNMNISKIEELGTNAVTVVANQFSGVVTRDFRVDVSADGTADFYINGSNIATGTGFWVTGGNNTARMGFGLESQTDATTVSDINIYKASHTINP